MQLSGKKLNRYLQAHLASGSLKRAIDAAMMFTPHWDKRREAGI